MDAPTQQRERDSPCDGICSQNRGPHVMLPVFRNILFGYVDSVLGSLHCVDVVSVTNVSEIHCVLFFRVEVCKVG
jgi:hypothetical protein